MAREIVAGMFGIDPALLGQQQMATDVARAYQFANLTPSEQSQYSAYLGGTMGGRALGGLLGVEDPVMAKASLASRLASQFDITTERGLRDYAAALAQGGAPDLAQMAVKRADEMQVSQATVAQKTREKLPTIGQLQAYRDQLIREVGPNDPRVAEVNKVIAAEGEGKGVKVVLPGEAQDKILREKRTGKFLDLEDAALAATDTLQAVNDFRGLVNKSFTGLGANAKLTAAQLASALGLEVSGTTESEQLDQLFADLTVGKARNLKGNLSDKDVKFLKEAIGTRGLTTSTLNSVIERIERGALIDAKTFELAQNYTGDMARFNINEIRKQAQTDVNERIAKQRRLNELRQKAGQPQPR
jgi:hypothetical protein